MNVSVRTSELVLASILLVIVGFTRVYYGGPDGLMVVWKGEFGFKDTLVDLGSFSSLPRNVAVAEHANVLYQLEEMGLVDQYTEPAHIKPRPEPPAKD